ncbi:HlyD family type I secretion periplasmic adaptor subunit [Candidatus Bandiella euplotis]|uniref:Membrane fusion protein (MFP) family protein n=1 Tax=Candidatus Bandiella euplotis TaxID=1664265 RepID=A0ABZ0URL9_9RICK|nr:HlyD family type I secretion periplasmic adaptor subunit [Candidatus Bandiella woodruffii]WPX96680.1 Putative AprE family type I secretion periplasmic adaptor subunit [Candidatus Bandiella woodruffii]
MTENQNNDARVINKDAIEVIAENKKADKKKPVGDANNDFIENTKQAKPIDFEENLLEKYKNYKIIDIQEFKKFLTEAKDFLFGITLEKSNYIEENEKDISKQISRPIKFGLISVAVALGFFGVWSGLAPLDSASIAEGFIILSENRKKIQHLEGGIVDQILVKDGDQVKKGQPLIVFNQFRSKADLEQVLWQLRHAIIVDKRLVGSLNLISHYQNKNQSHDSSLEQAPEVEFSFDSKYIDQSDQKVATLINAQKNAYNSYKAFIENQIKSSTAQLNQIQSEIKSTQENIRTLEKEYAKKKELYEKQLETSERFSHTKMQLQEQRGRLASLEHKIAEASAKEAQFMDDQNVRLSEEYKRNHGELIQMEARYLQTKDTHERSVVNAPYAGVVTNLQVHTVGAAIQQTQMLLEIIPQDDTLVIEAYIPAHEVESIQVGSIARIQLNAYKARLVPRIEGKVIYVSADKFDKEVGMMPGQPRFMPVGYYKARIEVSPEELDKVNTQIKLLPGMPVTVFIVKGVRSFAEYLYSPIKDSFHKAFKEP